MTEVAGWLIIARKQPTAKPTFRWIMQNFQGIHWINLEDQRQISNLTEKRQLITRLLGPSVERGSG